ncbi:hypothetical protein LCGC14_1896060 [marine sediment metagenome]|uniref:Uncharacterized protein n=1 Tax=marine sediment metagenome TaxID=412755 RepID=A0A0F9FY29_9ZZZZ
MEKTSFEDRVDELLWDCLLKDPEHKDRRRTGFGTKTLKGLTSCIVRIIKEELLGDDTTKKA